MDAFDPAEPAHAAPKPKTLADATLIVLAERLDITQIATTDKTDFAAYRTKTGKHFSNVF